MLQEETRTQFAGVSKLSPSNGLDNRAAASASQREVLTSQHPLQLTLSLTMRRARLVGCQSGRCLRGARSCKSAAGKITGVVVDRDTEHGVEPGSCCTRYRRTAPHQRHHYSNKTHSEVSRRRDSAKTYTSAASALSCDGTVPFSPLAIRLRALRWHPRPSQSPPHTVRHFRTHHLLLFPPHTDGADECSVRSRQTQPTPMSVTIGHVRHGVWRRPATLHAEPAADTRVAGRTS